MPYRALVLLLLVVVAGCGVRAKTVPNMKASVYPVHNDAICLLAGTPPVDIQYEVLGRVVATKRTYGSPDELLVPMVREAQRLGADALINLQAGQRFKGPLPWRVTSPTGDSSAIKLLSDSPRLDCEKAGGRLFGGKGTGAIGLVEGNSVPPTGLSQQDSKAQHEGASPIRDKYDDLERLKKLLDQGVLTQEEFEREKAKVLN